MHIDDEPDAPFLHILPLYFVLTSPTCCSKACRRSMRLLKLSLWHTIDQLEHMDKRQAELTASTRVSHELRAESRRRSCQSVRSPFDVNLTSDLLRADRLADTPKPLYNRAIPPFRNLLNIAIALGRSCTPDSASLCTLVLTRSMGYTRNQLPIPHVLPQIKGMRVGGMPKLFRFSSRRYRRESYDVKYRLVPSCVFLLSQRAISATVLDG